MERRRKTSRWREGERGRGREGGRDRRGERDREIDRGRESHRERESHQEREPSRGGRNGGATPGNLSMNDILLWNSLVVQRSLTGQAGVGPLSEELCLMDLLHRGTTTGKKDLDHLLYASVGHVEPVCRGCRGSLVSHVEGREA
jgi:hypothetical protein